MTDPHVKVDKGTGSDTIVTGRSHTPSISSQRYAIPITDDMTSQLSVSTTSSSSFHSNEGSYQENNSTNQDSLSFEALNIAEDEDEDNVNTDINEYLGSSSGDPSNILNISHELLLTESHGNDLLRHTTSNANFIPSQEQLEQDPDSMIDVSKYIFDSLIQAIESVDFSEALAQQTKVSAKINAKSLELKQLIDETRVKLTHLNERFQEGRRTSQRVKQILSHSRNTIQEINGMLATEFPIEFSQARDRIIERTLSDEDV